MVLLAQKLDTRDDRKRRDAEVRHEPQEAQRCANIVEEVGHSSPVGRRHDSMNPADSAGETAMVAFQETPARLFYDLRLDEHVPADRMLGVRPR
jgi:hypothetical protein